VRAGDEAGTREERGAGSGQRKERRPPLPVIAVWTVMFLALVAAGVVRYASVVQLRRDVSAARMRIGQYTDSCYARSALLHRIEELERFVEQERDRYFAGGEIESAEFGVSVKRAMSVRGLEIDAFHVVRGDGAPVFEISAAGDAESFADFLRSVETAARYLDVSYLTLSAAGERVRVGFRISYRTLEGREARNDAPPILPEGGEEEPSDTRDIVRIASLFQWGDVYGAAGSSGADAGTADSTAEAGAAGEYGRDEGRQPQWLIYIGDYIESDRTFLLLRDTRTNRVYTLPANGEERSGWRVVRVEGSNIVLEKDGVLYTVNR